ncbi:MAG: SPOR domain-containing protein [Desulfobaccales bacterium]
MNKRVFKGLGLGALLLGSLIILLLILYHFLGSRPAPVPTGKLEVKPQTLPGVSAAPGTPPPLAAPIAPPLEPSPAPPGGGVGISGTTPPKTAISPPPAKEPPLAPLEEERKYGLSLGAFPNFRSAEKMLDKLRNQGEPGFIRRTPGKRQRYQVIAGPFSSRQEAEVAAKLLKTKLHVSPKLATIIIPVSK